MEEGIPQGHATPTREPGPPRRGAPRFRRHLAPHRIPPVDIGRLRRPHCAGRKKRIARGSGTSVQEVNMLLSQFRQMQRMMKQLTGGGKRGRRGLMSMLGGLGQ